MNVRPARIAHAVLTFGFGGAELAMAWMAIRARGRGENVRIVAPKGGRCAAGLEGIAPGLASGPSIRTPDLPSSRGAWQFAVGARTRLRGVDVAHLHLPWPDLLGALLIARASLPAVATFHLLPDGPWPRDLLLGPGVFDLPGRVARRGAPIVLVGVSEHDGRELRRRFPKLRVEVVSNCPPPPRESATPLPWGPGDRLLAVGRLSRQKGLDRLLVALSAEPMRSRAWSLCLVGDGEERGALERLAQRLGIEDRVRLVGTLPVAYATSRADLFLSGSRSEGLSLALLEAMEAGLPACVSPIPSHVEVAGGCGEMLLDDDEGCWPLQLAALLDSPPTRRMLAEHGRRRVAERYTAGRQDDSYRALYDELARYRPDR